MVKLFHVASLVYLVGLQQVVIPQQILLKSAKIGNGVNRTGNPRPVNVFYPVISVYLVLPQLVFILQPILVKDAEIGKQDR